MKIQHRTRRLLRLACSSVVAAVALGWCGCGSEPKPITSQTSKYQVADDHATTGNAGDRSVENPAIENPKAPSSDAGSTIPSATSAFSAASKTRSPAATSADTSPAGSSRRTGDVAGNPGPSGDPSDTSGAPPKPSSQPPVASDATPTTADGPSRLLAHIEKLQSQDPRAATREESLSNLVKIQREIVKTASQVITSKADELSVLRAAEAKIRALTLLSQVQPEAREAQAEIKTFVVELKKSSHPKLVRLASRMEFAQMMDAFANNEAADVPKLMAEFKKLFENEEKDVALFSLCQQVIEIFIGTRHAQEATEVMKLVADAFDKHTNAQLANASKMIREQIPILELDLSGKFTAVQQGKPKAEEEFLATLDKLFANRELGAITLQILTQMTQAIESQNLELAEKTYAKMTAAFAKQSTPEVAKVVQGMATNFAKRKAIVGQPFIVDGVTLDGQPFDWGKFKGKVILVDFWATWCGPCLEEIPNIKQNYDQYRDQGFEVVGVNLDDKPEDVQRFFSRQRLPWPTVLSPDPQKVGFEHPLAEKCGIEGIPFLVLVDRDGKALALNLRGEELGKKLATMFPGTGASQSNPLRTDPAKKAGGKGG